MDGLPRECCSRPGVGRGSVGHMVDKEHRTVEGLLWSRDEVVPRHVGRRSHWPPREVAVRQ